MVKIRTFCGDFCFQMKELLFVEESYPTMLKVEWKDSRIPAFQPTGKQLILASARHRVAPLADERRLKIAQLRRLRVSHIKRWRTGGGGGGKVSMRRAREKGREREEKEGGDTVPLPSSASSGTYERGVRDGDTF